MLLWLRVLTQEMKFNENQSMHLSYTPTQPMKLTLKEICHWQSTDFKPKSLKKEGTQPLNDLHVCNFSASRICPLLMIVIIMTPQLYIYSPSSYLTFYIQSNPPFLAFNSCIADYTKQQRKWKKELHERMEECSLLLNLLEVVIPSLWHIIMGI